jgi:hypothetical protein
MKFTERAGFPDFTGVLGVWYSFASAAEKEPGVGQRQQAALLHLKCL